ncbi:MAG: CapA family protein [Paludibacteraceae bacterium]|nr:CapA family protein [Paludibacteraceae bacterium]
MRKLTLILLFTAVTSILLGVTNKHIDNKIVSKYEDADSDKITIVFAGDLMVHQLQLDAAHNKKTNSYDFNPCFSIIKPYIQSADLAIANLETTFSGKPYTGYPYFSSPETFLETTIKSGFDIFQIANNHIADKGSEGIKQTVKLLSAKTTFVGSYIDKQQRDSLYPLIVEKKGLKMALLNCTYGTENPKESYQPCVVNLIDTVQIHQDVITARKRGAKFVIMTIHWGDEYTLAANEEQKMLARYFTHIGINLIIGSHPHTVQDFEIISLPDSSKVPVFYSLGNFISNQRKENSNGGILAYVTINTKNNRILNCSYLPTYVHREYLQGKYQYYILPIPEYLKHKTTYNIGATADSLLHIFYRNTTSKLSNISIHN